MLVREITDHDAIGRFLRNSLVESAYQLGYLDPAYSEFCSWWGAEAPGLQTLILLYSGLSRPGLFTAGNPAHMKTILREFSEQLPERITGHIGRNHLDAVRSHYREREDRPLRLMKRMGLRRDQFQGDTTAAQSSAVEVLSHRDTAAIMRLYHHFPDNFFEPYQLETGLYFGVRSDDGELACIAGIHNVSEKYDVAAIGNLVTHPDHRGKGYARLVTTRLLDAAFTRVSNVTLDVEDGNNPAMSLYQHFGFRFGAEFWEGELTVRR